MRRHSILFSIASIPLMGAIAYSQTPAVPSEAAPPASVHTTPLNPPPPDMSTWGNSYRQLKLRGESVYVAKVMEHTPLESNGRQIVGMVTLKVVDVLRGPRVEVLTLPYSYPDLRAYGRRLPEMVWPDRDSLPVDALLLLVVGPGQDIGDPAVREAPLVATTIRHLKGADDPIVKDYKTILSLCDTKAEDLPKAMLKAAGDHPYTPLTKYLETAAPIQLKPKESFEVMGVLLNGLLEAKSWPPASGVDAAASLRRYYLLPDTPLQDRLEIIRIFSRMIAYDGNSISFYSLNFLAGLFEPTLLPSGSLNGKDLTELQAALRKASAQSADNKKIADTILKSLPQSN